jgi:hypothetical protein
VKPVVLIEGPDSGEYLTAEQRTAAIESYLEHHSGVVQDEISAAADAYFTDEYPANPTRYLNALLRESWRGANGNTRKWDVCARAAGMFTLGKVIL